MGGPEHDDEQRPRSRGRRLVLGALTMAVALVVGLAWVDGQVPQAVALQQATMPAAVSQSTRDVQAAIVADRLAAAAGHSLASLAEGSAAAGPVSDLETPTLVGSMSATEKYAEALAQLGEAEEAAAAQLAQTEADVAAAEVERKKASKVLAEEEAAAAKAVDAAIDAAISAARAQSAASVDDFAWGGFGGTIPEGRSTGTAEVLDLVRKHFPADEVGNAMAVARCESGHANRVGKPNTNGSRDFGVFQINDGGTIQAALKRLGVGYADISDARAKALDPALNVRMARAIWDSRGWQPWVCAAKLKIVAGLYQRNPGPMYGKFDDSGRLATQ